MGYLKEKYTREYFTGKDENGNSVGYGATLAYDKKGDLILREHDRLILDQINFSGKRVLGLGIGRGEELFYAVGKGARSCIGVDFSQSAIEIAAEIVAKKGITSIKLENEDALVFLKNYTNQSSHEKFDIIIMFDFVEHVPRAELKEILQTLKNLLAEKSVIAINTPAYKYDNDVISNGFDERNLVNCFDTSDTNEATGGMHCNKYSVPSLQSFMDTCGYSNITEMHFFVPKQVLPEDISRISYLDRWSIAHGNGHPIHQIYTDDIIEYPYSDAPELKWKKFKKGNLQDITLYVTDEYASLAYEDGDIDSQMVRDLAKNNKLDDAMIFDIGACVGVDSFVFAKIIGASGRVVAFEPNEYNRNRFFLNLSHNPALCGKIKVFSYALGDESSTAEMTISSNIDQGHSSTSRIGQAHAKINEESLPEGFFKTNVNIITLDEFVHSSGFVPTVLKIDIEGAEHVMLIGAMNTIKKYRPVIYMELHSEYCSLICSQILTNLNYRISVLHEEEDNRLMVKAIYENSEKEVSVSELMLQSYINLNSSTQIMRSVNASIGIVLNVNKQLQTENERLHMENDNLQIEAIRWRKEKKEILGNKVFKYSLKVKKYLRKFGVKKF